MDHRLLLYFTTLIDEGTFTQAAKTLHISQPSLSAAIKRLEDLVSLTLIERSTRSFSITREGEIVYKEAKKLLNHFQYVEQELHRLKDQGPSEIQIGLIESVKFWLPKVLKTYTENNPGIRIKLSEVLGLKQVEQTLHDYKIHIAITNQHIEDHEIKTIPIYKENLVVLLPKDHPLKDQDEIAVGDIEDERLIISKEGFQTRDDILKEFRKQGKTPNILFEIERFETAYSLVEENLGITIVPENYIKDAAGSNIVIKPIKSSNLSRTVYLAHLKHRYLPPNVESFIDITKAFFHS